MVTRINLGLVFSNDENWIGGTYYILNLISALNTVPDEIKPFLVVIIAANSDKTLIEATNYQYLKFKYADPTYPFFKRAVNWVYRSFFEKNFFEKRVTDSEIDFIFPGGDAYSIQLISNRKQIYWIPDFQERYYPHFFTAQQLKDRGNSHEKIADTNNLLILSSEDAKKDFITFFPNYKCETEVVNFSVTLPAFQTIPIISLLKKYAINTPYFICSNQFWLHKNHKVLLESVLLLKENGYTNFTVVLTGKEYDYRNPLHFEQLRKFANDNNLNPYFRFLGLIDRKEQLSLMNNSLAIIQPSLFEGWSTVVEDAKALNKFILLADIPVLREQMHYNCDFFNPHDEKELSNKMLLVLENKDPVEVVDYSLNIKNFGLNFISKLNK